MRLEAAEDVLRRLMRFDAAGQQEGGLIGIDHLIRLIERTRKN